MKKNAIFLVTPLIVFAACAQGCGDSAQTDKIFPKNTCFEANTLTVYKSADVSYELPCKYGCVDAGAAADDYCNTACPDEEGELKCDEENAKKLLVCKNGFWVNKSDCKFGCSDNACNARPDDWCDNPGELKCENDALLACSSENKSIRTACAKCLNVNNDPVCIKDRDCLDINKNGIYDVFDLGFEFESADGVFLNGAFNAISCESNAQCEGYRQICLFGKSCARECKSDYNCIEGYKCTKAGICRKPGGKDGADSNGNGILDIDEPEFDGTDFAGKTCQEHADCNSDQTCLHNGKCASECTGDNSCIDGYKCRASGLCSADGFAFSFPVAKGAKILLPSWQYKNCDFKIDWGDGTGEKQYTDCPTELTHEYDKDFESVTVTIDGSLDGFAFLDESEKNGWHHEFLSKRCPQNLTVESFGNIGLGIGAFFNCQNLRIAAKDIPKPEKHIDMTWFFALASFADCSNADCSVGRWDLSHAANLSGMFNGAANIYQDISNWDVSNVANMSNMFAESSDFNRDISNWDVSNVANMSGMFRSATSFNQDISNWNVSNAEDMSYMFDNAQTFNQSLSNWNVFNVKNMSGMFRFATSFNQDISSWNVSNVINMSGMFKSATSFNQDISNWDVSKVTDMSYMFNDAQTFNQSLSNWNVYNVKNMNAMFKSATSFNQNISNWDVSKVTDMSYMFDNAQTFNQSLSNWNVSNVKNMSGMFRFAISFNQSLFYWQVSNVTNMSAMFRGAAAFNQYISAWNVSNVTNMNEMFMDAASFNKLLSNWNVSKVKSMSQMFYGAIKFNQDISGWKLSSIPYAVNVKDMFSNSGISQTIWCKIIANTTFKQYIKDIWPGCAHKCD